MLLGYTFLKWLDGHTEGKYANNIIVSEFKSFSVGLQISFGVCSEDEEENDLWRNKGFFEANIP